MRRSAEDTGTDDRTPAQRCAGHSARGQVRTAPASAGPLASAVVGGLLWALTPLRQPLFDAGRTPEEGVAFFRGYNALIVLVAVLLTVAHLRLRAGTADGRAYRVGWWTVLVGHLLVLLGALIAVVLGASARDVVMAGQDASFLGAMLAAVGALPLGISGLRRGTLPKPTALLFAATLPGGVLGLLLLGAAGASEDVLGLPLTVLYGGAWMALGAAWAQRRRTR